MKLKKCIREGKRKIGLIMSMMILITVVIPSSMTYAAQRVAKVESMQGEVTVYKSGQEKEYKGFKGMSLSEGDRIETGKKSWVLLGIDKDKGVKIGDNTTINISELKDLGEGNSTQFQVLKGKVWNEVKEKLNSNSKYEIKTPTAVMGVRGTEFFVSYEKGILKVGVIEGEVGAKIYNFEKDDNGEWKLNEVEYVVNPMGYLSYEEGKVFETSIKVEELDEFILQNLLENKDKLSEDLIKKIENSLEELKKKEEKEIIEDVQKKIEEDIDKNNIRYETSIINPSTGTSSGGGSSNITTPPVLNIQIQSENQIELNGIYSMIRFMTDPEDTTNNVVFSDETAINNKSGQILKEGSDYFFEIEGKKSGHYYCVLTSTKNGYQAGIKEVIIDIPSYIDAIWSVKNANDSQALFEALNSQELQIKRLTESSSEKYYSNRNENIATIENIQNLVDDGNVKGALNDLQITTQSQMYTVISIPQSYGDLSSDDIDIEWTAENVPDMLPLEENTDTKIVEPYKMYYGYEDAASYFNLKVTSGQQVGTAKYLVKRISGMLQVERIY